MSAFRIRKPFTDVVDSAVLPRLIHLSGDLYAAAFQLMKLLPAQFVLQRALEQGQLTERSTVIETTSGTYGLGLAMVCRRLGLPLILVGDTAIDSHLRRRLEALGARVSIVSGQAARTGGIQQARLDRVKRIRARHRSPFTPGQYDNTMHANAYGRVAELITESFPQVDALICPVGSGSSSTGIAGFLRLLWPDLVLIGVDTPGSVLFGAPNGRRRLRGLGNGLLPKVLDHSLFDEVHWVPAGDAFAMTRRLHADHTLFMGPTSGAAYQVGQWWRRHNPGGTVLAVMPDEGHRYQRTVFHDAWLRREGLAGVEAPREPTEIAHPGDLEDRWSRYAWGRRTRDEVVDLRAAVGTR
ncbi:cysteine synthase family protein [Micromonospora sp. NPDC006431]|uniref:cysteine synthase family protein n=1 Tax=Micromonospora sp. NPDC006431 TaxID=3364235 RepID=UPI00367A3446